MCADRRSSQDVAQERRYWKACKQSCADLSPTRYKVVFEIKLQLLPNGNHYQVEWCLVYGSNIHYKVVFLTKWGSQESSIHHKLVCTITEVFIIKWCGALYMKAI